MNRLILAVIFSLPSTLLGQTFTYAPVNVPGAVATQARGINNNGDGGGFGTFPSGGWVWINGTFYHMDPNNGAGPCCEWVTGVSNNGILSGVVFQSDFWMAWMKESTDEDFFTFPQPGTTNGCCDTTGTGVNNNVDMIGFGGGIGLSGQVGTGWFTKHIESNEGTNDTVEATPSFISVAFPKSGSTYHFGF